VASIGGTLQIPEQLIVGTGSYVVPVNRYGFISMSVSCSARGDNGDTNNNSSGAGASGGSSSNANHQYITEGTVINTSNSYPSASYTGSFGNPQRVDGHSRVQLNAVASTTGWAAWSLSLYRIPKANLPVGAAEGE